MTLPKIVKADPCPKCGCENYLMQYIDTWNPLSRFGKRIMISCENCRHVVWPAKESIDKEAKEGKDLTAPKEE